MNSRKKKGDLRDGPAQYLYDRMKGWAEGAKVFLQMILGAAAVIIVLAVLINDVDHGKSAGGIERQVFVIIAAVLAGAAALELAYTLFTPSADELIDPLMLGVSAALLYLVSNLTQLTWQAGVAVVLFTTALAVLFRVRASFIAGEKAKEDSDADQGRGPELTTDDKPRKDV